TLYIAGFGRGEILSLPVSGGQPTVLASGAPLMTTAGIAVSPDGSTLYIADNSAGKAFSMPASGGNLTVLAPGFTNPGPNDVQISLDGKYLYLSTWDQGVLRVPVQGGPATPFANANGSLFTSLAVNDHFSVIVAGDEGWRQRKQSTIFAIPPG